MKLSTQIVQTIEMTRQEENDLWDTPIEKMEIGGKRAVRWDTADGRNEILLEGEDFYRPIVIVG